MTHIYEKCCSGRRTGEPSVRSRSVTFNLSPFVEFNWCRHFCDGYQGPRHLTEKLVGVFFLGQRLREQCHDCAMAKLLGEVFGSRVSGDLVVLHPLRFVLSGTPATDGRYLLYETLSC